MFGIPEVELRPSRETRSGRKTNLDTLVGYRGWYSDAAAPEAIEAVGSPPKPASVFSQGWVF
jgi:hypothetical protein